MDFCTRKLGFATVVPPPTGSHKKIGTLPFRFPGSCFAKIFYPAAETQEKKAYLKEKRTIKELYKYNTSRSGAYRYTRYDVVSGMSKWLGTSLTFFKLSIGRITPVTEFMLEPEGSDQSSTKYPVMVFSHGLGGNADIYSKFCTEIASHGYIVIALEHEDGSGSFAYDVTNNEKIYYKSPGEFPYKRPLVINFRKPFLEKRCKEIEGVMDFVLKAATGDVEDSCFRINAAFEKQLFSMMDLENLCLAGHSFGGATVLTALHSFQAHPLQDVFKAAVLLDVWPMPVSEEVLKEGTSVPFISMLSEEFYNYDEYKLTKKILSNSNCKMSAYMKGVTHSQYSDGPWLVGLKSVKQKTKLEGTMPGKESQQAITDATITFLKQADSFSYDKLASTKFINISDELKLRS